MQVKRNLEEQQSSPGHASSVYDAEMPGIAMSQGLRHMYQITGCSGQAFLFDLLHRYFCLTVNFFICVDSQSLSADSQEHEGGSAVEVSHCAGRPCDRAWADQPLPSWLLLDAGTGLVAVNQDVDSQLACSKQQLLPVAPWQHLMSMDEAHLECGIGPSADLGCSGLRVLFLLIRVVTLHNVTVVSSKLLQFDGLFRVLGADIASAEHCTNLVGVQKLFEAGRDGILALRDVEIADDKSQCAKVSHVLQSDQQKEATDGGA